MEKTVLESAILELMDHYKEYGSGRSLDYTYGYMDALAALRAYASVRQNGQSCAHTGGRTDREG